MPVCSADLSSVREEEAMAGESLSLTVPTPTPENKGFFLAMAHTVVFRAFSVSLTLISPVLPEGLLELDSQNYEALSLSVPLFPYPKKGANTPFLLGQELNEVEYFKLKCLENA